MTPAGTVARRAALSRSTDTHAALDRCSPANRGSQGRASVAGTAGPMKEVYGPDLASDLSIHSDPSPDVVDGH
jgi:hypothetical protein